MAVIICPLPAAKLDNLSAVALGWSALRPGAEIHPCPPTLLNNLQPQFAARLRFAVERLSYRRRVAHSTEKQNFHLKITAFSPDL